MRLDEVGLFHRAAALHARLAWAACLAGRYDAGLAQVAAARACHGSAGPDRQGAAIDAVHALLLLDAPGGADPGEAGRLATAALAQAERHDDAVVACQALLALGVLAWERDPDAARDHLERARLLTDTHRLPLWRTHVLLRLGEHLAQADGDVGGLVLARDQADRGGAVAVSHAADARIVRYGQVLGGEYRPGEKPARLAAAAERHHLDAVVRHARVTRAVCAAHQADRAGMTEALAGIRAADGDPGLGLAQAFCALLEEDRDRARRDLGLAGGAPLSGRHGLGPLLDVLVGDLGPAELAAAAATPAGRLRWNRQFTALAEAVLHGRHGDSARAEAAAKEARDAARPYRMAIHLGARLVAEAALADGWGDPVPWLRAAEEYFHDAAVPAVSRRVPGPAAPRGRAGPPATPRPAPAPP